MKQESEAVRQNIAKLIREKRQPPREVLKQQKMAYLEALHKRVEDGLKAKSVAAKEELAVATQMILADKEALLVEANEKQQVLRALMENAKDGADEVSRVAAICI